MASLSGKVFAVTGAGSGIGLATAKILAARGASLGLADINQESLESLKASFKSSGYDSFEVFPLDIQNRSDVKDWLHKIRERFGNLNGCANIAATIGDGLQQHHIWEADKADFDHVINVNAGGLFNCLGEELKPGTMEEGGSIVNVASLTGLKGYAKCASYAASKHAVIGLTKVAAIEAGPRAIRVNAIAPGLIETPMLYKSLGVNRGAAIPPMNSRVPLARVGRPEEVGGLIAFLLGDESTFITGSVYTVDGGEYSG